MSVETATRDEFEEVKQLLASAARYAESVHRGLDRLDLAQQRTQLQIDQLALKTDQLTEAQKKTEQRFESFMSESQRLMTGHADRIVKLEGISERLEGILSYFIRQKGRGE